VKNKRIKKKAEAEQKPLYGETSPCATCPYQKTAKLQLWDRREFIRLLEMENDQMGAVYHCHKNDGSVCRGWLIDQDKRNFPSIMLRLSLSRHNITREYLDKLQCLNPMFDSVEEMCVANYKILKHFIKK